MSITRRKFLKGSAAGLGCLGMSSVAGLRYVSEAHAEELAGQKVKYVASSCAICTNKCVFRGQVVNGVIKRLEPQPEFAKGRGMMCARGNAGAWTPYDPNRVKYPMIRTGKRGEGKWKKATWDEAYAYIADKTNKVVEEEGGHRSCIGFVSSEGTYHEHYWNQFRSVFGSPNSLRHPTLCLSSVIRGFMAVVGTYPSIDIKNSKYIILAGADRAESIFTPDTMDMFSDRSKKIICLDPRFTKTAAKATKWYPIKPGTDMAFALAMMNVIIGEGLHNKAYVDKYAYGFNQLAQHVKQYTPEWAAKETDIPAQDIREIAREFAKTPNAVYYPGRRSSWQGNDVETRRAVAMVNVLVGAFDSEGGLVPSVAIKTANYFYEPAWYTNSRPRLEEGDVTFLNPRDGSWIPWRERAIKGDPYAIRGLYIYKQNVVASLPDRNKTMEMFDKMDIIVCVDTFMSDTAWHADVVLPETNYLERLDPPNGYGVNGIEPTLTIRQPLIKPMYDTRSGFEIVIGLAKYFEDEDGFTLDEYFEGDVESHTKDAVADYPGALEMMKEKGFFTDGRTAPIGDYLKGKKPFNTPTKKLELYSDDFKNRGFDPMPTYKRPEEIPSDRFRFVVGRHAIHTQSMTAAFPELNWHMPENTVWINSAKAKAMGIKSGDLVQLKNRTGGEVQIKAQVTEGIRPDCVYYANGYGSLSKGQPLVYGKGASQAQILEAHFEPISGNALMHETIVEIRKV
ncbi:MAG: molybdopterin-dependent oxidoreductase [Pelovirga sp.]